MTLSPMILVSMVTSPGKLLTTSQVTLLQLNRYYRRLVSNPFPAAWLIQLQTPR